MKKIKIGLLYAGNYLTLPWGSVVTTYYLSKAFNKLGYETWLYSVTENRKIRKDEIKDTNLIISEGVPYWQIPSEISDMQSIKIFWWLSDLFYNLNNIINSEFDGVATNSETNYNYLIQKGVASCKIDLCADEEFAKATINKDRYINDIVYLGKYPHKEESQYDLLFAKAIEYNFGIWGTGWEDSKYYNLYNGILPFYEIGSLYRSSEIAFILTETKQKKSEMINNRTYEILMSECIPLCEQFDYLQKTELGEFIYFVNTQEEVEYYIEYIKQNKKRCLQKSIKAQKLIAEKHNYNIRATQFLDFYNLIND